MIGKTLLAAIAAGLIAGAFMTAAQEMRVVPLILQAETYESEGAPAAYDQSSRATQTLSSTLAAVLPLATPAQAHGVEQHGDDAHAEGGIMFGLSRFSGTLVANLVTGAGFALLLAGLSTLLARPITVQTGLTWGALGWLAVHLLPAIGLPPELPGFPAADLGDRQTWWLLTTIVSAVGLGVLAIRPEIPAKIVGLLLIAVPHLFGAPQASDIASPVPAVLGAEFAVAALATTLAFWLVLGVVYGAINERFTAFRR
jgi:cobalt transporter subunit CbtA